MTIRPALRRSGVALLATAALLLAMLSFGTTSAQAIEAIYTEGGSCQVLKKKVKRHKRAVKKTKKKVAKAERRVKRADTRAELRTAKQKLRKAKKRLKKAKRRLKASRAKRSEVCGPSMTLVSVSSSGKQGNGHSYEPEISANDRYVVFLSAATNLVKGDTNGTLDVFVRDTVKDRTKRVSVSSSGQQANGESSDPTISADGRYIAFSSAATNLVPGDTNDRPDIFVRDRRTGTTTRVSTSASGGQAAGSSRSPSISANGRHVAYMSYARNITSPAATGSGEQGYVHDRLLGRNTLVTVNHQGVSADSGAHELEISGNGQYVAFTTWATNFLSGRGGHDDNMVWTWNRATNKGRIMSVTNTGAADPDPTGYGVTITADGRFVAFESRLVEHDVLLANTVVRFDQLGGVGSYVREFGPAIVSEPVLSPLVLATGAGQRVLDTVTGAESRLEMPGRAAANERIYKVAIAVKGRALAFETDASNIVKKDRNDKADVFVRRR